MVESILLSTALIAALSVLLGILYFGFIHAGVNYLLHEFMVCESTQGEKNCEKDFTKKLRVFLISGRLLKFESRRGSRQHQVRVLIEMPLNQNMRIVKQFERIK